MKTNLLTVLVVSFIGSVCTASTFAYDKDPSLPDKILDFTAGAKLPENAPHDWNLGPTGARGWCQVSAHGAEGTTKDSRQILITEVTVNGASAKHLKVGDVILGIGDTKFQSDARVEFAKAISAAESSDGKLVLLRFRGGKTKSVSIQLPSLPEFSETAPYRCKKSTNILRHGCDAIANRGLGRPQLSSFINALTLLATGDKRYLPLVSEFAKKTVAQKTSPNVQLVCWHFSFANIFLCEYYLSTGDKSVLPEIRRLTGHLIDGQGPLGTWGHKFVDKSNDRLSGYGAVNAVGLPAAISLVLARECGARPPGLDESIELSAAFFRRHVGLGNIPYGDGPPAIKFGHDDNGKNSAAAIFFNFLGDEDATDYYTRTAIASYGLDREQGHTGNFFNLFWSLPAVSLAGPEATGAWLNEFGWYYDLARDDQLQFRYQGYPRQTPKNAYAKWNCPGAYLLHFALPLKKIRLTGRKSSCLSPFDEAEVSECIAAGNFQPKEMKTEALRVGVMSWSPIVRKESINELRKRKQLGGKSQKLRSKDPLERIAALRLGMDPRIGVKALKDSDSRVRISAIEMLASINKKQAAGYVFEHLSRNPDEIPVVTQAIGSTFFSLKTSPMKVAMILTAPSDRQSVIKSIFTLLDDEDALVAAGVAKGLYALPDNELVALVPVIYERAQQAPIGNIMFSSKLRVTCAELLTRLQLQEGIETSAKLVADTSWGRVNRIPLAAAVLSKNASHAKPVLGELKAALKEYPDTDNKWHKLIKDTITKIENAPAPKQPFRSLRDLE